MSDVIAALATLSADYRDDVSVAVSAQLDPDEALSLARLISDRLDQVGVPVSQRTWIVAARDEDSAVARTAAAVSDVSGAARLIVHNPQEPDDLIFQRRIPGQRRGGIYLNAAWQSASVRIGCGDAGDLVVGLAAWFNAPGQVQPKDLQSNLTVG